MYKGFGWIFLDLIPRRLNLILSLFGFELFEHDLHWILFYFFKIKFDGEEKGKEELMFFFLESYFFLEDLPVSPLSGDTMTYCINQRNNVLLIKLHFVVYQYHMNLLIRIVLNTGK
ncbi:hypothetical protein ACH5RR_011946 [Cinchona calisaya]|uniref:Uncharacterized protein n=1 Tax=Cinchona calisaya TaxID=153742 RepID=A0ABD3A9S2_9GENT